MSRHETYVVAQGQQLGEDAADELTVIAADADASVIGAGPRTLVRIDASGRPTSTPTGVDAPTAIAVTADGPRIKRVERPEPGQMQLLSDNNEYPVEVLTGDRLKRAEIIGKVVWWGHTVRE